MTDLAPPPSVAPAAPPPHPLDALWRVRLGEAEYGPVTGLTLRGWLQDGRIDAASLVNPGEADEGWVRLDQDRTLASLVRLPSTALTTQESGGRDLVAPASEPSGVTVNIVQNFSASSAPRGEYDTGPRNPLFAMILSVLLPGAGQIYNGRAGRACTCLALTILLWLMWLGWIMNLLAAAEAYLDAKSLTAKYFRRHGELGLGGAR